MNEKPGETLICESCRKTFECGAKTGNCWCFFVEIHLPNLAKLKEQFQNCLCPECLKNSSIPANQTQGN